MTSKRESYEDYLKGPIIFNNFVWKTTAVPIIHKITFQIRVFGLCPSLNILILIDNGEVNVFLGCN
jgi:hypothetical protein